MNKKIKILIFTFLLSLIPAYSKVSAADFNLDNVQNLNVDTNKEWVVKFNAPLKAETVNNKNIVITDEKGTVLPVTITQGSDSSTIIISPKVSGYDPDKKYNLTLNTDLQSIFGRKLTTPITMNFTTANKYNDGTSYEKLPQITSCKFEFTPLLPNEKQGFFLNTQNGDNVQYRIFVHSYADNADVYGELTNGYTSASGGKITSLKTLKSATNGQKYKVIIYAKRTGAIGAHKDSNTDYDNYYVDYFRCVDSINTSNNTYVKYDLTMDNMIDIQKNLSSKAVFVEYNDFNNEATKNQIKYYLDANNFMDSYGKYQFLKLSYAEGVSVEDLNNILKGKGILEGQGQAFLDAAKDNNINVAYLVSHALLETGNGTSLLANGGLKDADGNYIYGVPVYNFFGIGANDSDPNKLGTTTAYENKWLTPEDAIKGGASWISSLYINNPEYKQDTLYKMRWNPGKPGEHEYATDISWAYKQISNIKNILDQTKNVVLNFEIPQFK